MQAQSCTYERKRETIPLSVYNDVETLIPGFFGMFAVEPFKTFALKRALRVGKFVYVCRYASAHRVLTPI